MPIGANLRSKLNNDPFMTKCIHRYMKNPSECDGRITFEHAWIYAGNQIQERWAIVPVCVHHHLGTGLNKNYNRFVALLRADIQELERTMPKKNWEQELKFLNKIYGERTNIENIPDVEDLELRKKKMIYL